MSLPICWMLSTVMRGGGPSLSQASAFMTRTRTCKEGLAPTSHRGVVLERSLATCLIAIDGKHRGTPPGVRLPGGVLRIECW